MKSYCLVGLAVVWLTAAIPGCQSVPSTTSPPSTATAAKPNTTSPPSVLRLQKDDGRKKDVIEPVNFLDVVPSNSREAAQGQLVSCIRAMVNGTPILDNEIKDACLRELLEAQMRFQGSELSKEIQTIYARTLEFLIEQELLYQDAMERLKKNNSLQKRLKEAAHKDFDRWLQQRKNRFKSDEEFQHSLQAQGISISARRTQHEHKFFADVYLYNRISGYVERDTSHGQIREYYDNHPEEFRRADGVRWQYIFIKAAHFPKPEESRRFAMDIVRKLRSGEDFGKLATRSDVNDGLSIYHANGEGNAPNRPSRRGEVQPPELEPILFQLRDGEVFGPKETPTGFHILRLIKRDYEGQMSFDEAVQEQIRKKLHDEAFERERRRFVDYLRSHAVIEYARRETQP